MIEIMSDSGLSVISRTNSEFDSARAVTAAKVGGIASEGETPNSGICYANIGSGIAKGKIAEGAADFVPVVIERTAAFGPCGGPGGDAKTLDFQVSAIL